MKTLKYLLVSIIFLVIITTSVFLYRWIGKEAASKIPGISSDLKMEGVHLTRAVAGKTEWELRARSASYSRNKGVTYLDTPEVVLYGKRELKIELKGEKGEVFNDTNDISISGNVIISTTDGYTLRTESLNYSSSKREVSTESRVVVKGKGMEVEGVGMAADINDNGWITIKRDVKAVMEGDMADYSMRPDIRTTQGVR